MYKQKLQSVVSVCLLLGIVIIMLLPTLGQVLPVHAQATSAHALQLQSDYSLPNWWDGTHCDSTNNPQANPNPLTVWRGIEVCAPLPGKSNMVARPFPGPSGTPSENEFQCTELVARYLWLAYGLAEPHPTDGSGIVDTFTQDNVSGNPFYGNKIPAGGSIKMLPVIGDVLSFTPNHTAIVTNVTNPNAQAGSADVTIIEQNVSSSGTETLHMSGWQMSGAGGTVTSWMTTRNVSSPAEPGGWWIGPTPSDLTVINSGATVAINFRASSNNSGNLTNAAITTWTQSGGWQTVPASKVKITQYSSTLWDAYTEVPMPNALFQVSVNVYSQQGYQLAPNGIRHYCPASACTTSMFPGGSNTGGASQLANNLAPSALLDHPGASAAVDGDLNTEWVGGNKVPLGFVFPSPVTIQSVVVFDRKQDNPDNNQINKAELVFSDGTVVTNIDMTSGGPRCAEIDFPAKTVSWVNVVPLDASGNNGFSEVQIWDTSGSVYSQNNCVMQYAVTPTQGTGPAPLIPVPSPAGTSSVFEDFSSGIGNWWTNGNVAAAQDNGDGIIRFTPAAQSAAEASKNVGTPALSAYNTITVQINLHGATLLGNDASALYLDQGGSWKYISLSDYVQQGLDGWQTAIVPVSNFQGFDQTTAFDRLGFRFWVSSDSTIDVGTILFSLNGLATQPFAVYDEGLAANWGDWSWCSNNNLADSSHPNTGSMDISWTVTCSYGGLALHLPSGVDTTTYATLIFALQASQAGQTVQVSLYDSAGNTGNPVQLDSYGGTPVAGQYTTYTIPLSAFQSTGTITGILIQDITGNGTEPAMYVDTILFQ